MIRERCAISLRSIGLAFEVVIHAHHMLDAVLDNEPKAAAMRELAVALHEFEGAAIGGWLDNEDTDMFYRVGEAFRDITWQAVRITGEGDFKRLILEREVKDEDAEPDYWPGGTSVE